ncbi:MAG: hypothetical protein VB862_18975 [Pirellulaceae bacterium]
MFQHGSGLPGVWSQVVLFCLVALAGTGVSGADPERPAQYRFESITIPAASRDEPIRPFSLAHAVRYVDQGALAWSGNQKCVSCHTNGTYLQIRPALTPVLGKPQEAIRKFFVQQLTEMRAKPLSELQGGIGPTQVAYLAAGLAEWDAHVSKQLSDETRSALDLMFQLQSKNGAWGNTRCWPPFESSDYQAATVAAMAIATAPGYSKSLTATHKKQLQSLLRYFKETPPAHDYARLLLLWVSARLPDVMTAAERAETIQMIFKHQQPDGGWSMRTFATPETWGAGGRAGKLRAELEFKDPPSDGHQTGLALVVLREAGISAKGARIQKGVGWLLSNQRQSGRWWTRSLNTDTYHFITYSGTVYPLLALHKCDALPVKEE